MKILKSSAWSVLEYVTYPIFIFLSTPYLLRTLGAEDYGLWMLLIATVGLGTIANGGTGAATVKEVSSCRDKGNTTDLNTTINVALGLSLVSGSILGLIIITAFWFGSNFFFNKMGDPGLVQLTGVAAAVLALIEQFENVFSSALKGLERFSLAARIEIISKIALVCTTLVVVSIFESLLILYISLIIFGGARLAVKLTISRKILNLNSINFKFSGSRKIISFAKWGWALGAGSMLFGIADRFLIGSLLGAVSLAHYAVALQLAQQIHALCAAGLSVLFPRISRNVGKDTRSSFIRIIKVSVFGCLSVSSILAITLIMFGHEILSIWLGKAEADSTTAVLSLLTIAYWILATNITPHFILLGLGKIKFLAISNLVAGLVFLWAANTLLKVNGLEGVGMARITYGIVTLVTFFPLFRHWSRLS